VLIFNVLTESTSSLVIGYARFVKKKGDEFVGYQKEMAYVDYQKNYSKHLDPMFTFSF
jgi:hypothetical protein